MPIGFGRDTGIRYSQTAVSVVFNWPQARASAFNATQIRRSTSAFPATVADGTLVTSNCIPHVVDTGLTENTQYYYSFFARDLNNQWVRKKTIPVKTRTLIQQQQDMRSLVKSISAYAKGRKPGFLVVPNNGLEILTTPNGWADEQLETSYTNTIDGFLIESVFYTNSAKNSKATVDYIRGFLDTLTAANKKVFVIDYFTNFTSTSNRTKIDIFYPTCNVKSYLPFASRIALDVIPPYPQSPYLVNTDAVTSFSQAKNFLYLVNPQSATFFADVAATDYDIVFVDLFKDSVALTPLQVQGLQTKQSGARRLVLAYMSTGQLSDYVYYFNENHWNSTTSVLPVWAEIGDVNFPGDYWTHYWVPSWHKLLYGNSNAYLDRIIDAGFDGVILDVIDAYNHFQ
jgi:cysteinyl-tRNA synthetase